MTHSDMLMPRILRPIAPPASIGLIQWMDAYDVHANQNMATTRTQAATVANSRRLSGTGGKGFWIIACFWNRGSKTVMKLEGQDHLVSFTHSRTARAPPRKNARNARPSCP
jgi:hypothetical protein